MKPTKTKKKSLLLLFIGVIILLVTIPAFFSVIYFETEVTEYLQLRAEQNADFYINDLVDNNIAAIHIFQNTVSYLIGDKDIQDIMKKKTDLTGSELSVLQNTIGKTILYDVPWVDKYISSLFIFRQDDVALSTFVSGIFNPEYLRMKAVYHELKDISSMKSLVMTESREDDVFFIVDYIDISTLDPVGKVIIEINIENMVEADALQKLYAGTEVILSNGNNEILAVTSDEEKEDISAEFEKFNLSDVTKSGYSSWRGDQYYHRQEWLEDTDLKLDIFIPQVEILQAARKVEVWYTIIIIVTLILTGLICVLAYSAISDPLKLAISRIGQLAAGDFSVRMEDLPYRETEKLINSFNYMAENLERYYHEAYTKGVLLKESEYKLLEAQINPHFLFNLLEVINLKCMQAGQKDTSRMITDLARLLSTNIGRQGEQKVTFAQELEYVQYYLNLQKLRFAEDLSFTIEYEDNAILEYYLPKLTIQPLVENGIVHGLENQRGGGKVSVRIWEEEESVYISVSDNGIGFDQTKIDEALENASHNHVALNNIKRRINLLYGERGDLRINSSPGIGTTVVVIIPIDKEKG